MLVRRKSSMLWHREIYVTTLSQHGTAAPNRSALESGSNVSTVKSQLRFGEEIEKSCYVRPFLTTRGFDNVIGPV
jgi:hypothetical protein